MTAACPRSAPPWHGKCLSVLRLSAGARPQADAATSARRTSSRPRGKCTALSRLHIKTQARTGTASGLHGRRLWRLARRSPPACSPPGGRLRRRTRAPHSAWPAAGSRAVPVPHAPPHPAHHPRCTCARERGASVAASHVTEHLQTVCSRAMSHTRWHGGPAEHRKMQRSSSGATAAPPAMCTASRKPVMSMSMSLTTHARSRRSAGLLARWSRRVAPAPPSPRISSRFVTTTASLRGGSPDHGKLTVGKSSHVQTSYTAF